MTARGSADEEFLKAPFEPMVRGDDSRGTATGGAGLGLGKRLAESQGGTISSQNGAAGGAEFTVILRAGPASIL
jgi:signal transduction histidine kinase